LEAGLPDILCSQAGAWEQEKKKAPKRKLQGKYFYLQFNIQKLN